MSAYKSDFLHVLAARGFIRQISEPETLDGRALASKLTGYIGLDCTAPSLHVGSLLPIMMLYWMQQTGHRPIALMGGGTTRVGRSVRQGRKPQDPHGSRHRAQSSPASARSSCASSEFGDGLGDAVMANNADWLNALNYIDFLRDVGRHFGQPHAQLRSVKLRLDRQSCRSSSSTT